MTSSYLKNDSPTISSIYEQISSMSLLSSELNITGANETALPTLPSDADEIYVNFLELSRFWVQRILVPVVIVIGVIGNLMTIVIMTRRRMRSSTNFYLAALATCDMLYLIFTFLLSLKHYPDINRSEYYYYWALYPFSLMIADACTAVSVWLTVAFTIERFIVVSHPIKGKVICTEARAKKAIITIFIICFTYVLPTPFEWEIFESTDVKTNQTTIQARFSDFGNDPVFTTYYYWITAVGFVFVPLILLAVFNSFLIQSVHTSRKQRSVMTQSKIYHKTIKSDIQQNGRANKIHHEQAANSSNQENKITIMLISVVLLFLFCQLPTAGMLIYATVRTQHRSSNEKHLATSLNNICNLLVAINAAGNFVLYSLLSTKFRRTLIQLFCPCLKTRLSRLQSYQQTMYSTTKQTMSSCTYIDKQRSSNCSMGLNFKSESNSGTGVGAPGVGGGDCVESQRLLAVSAIASGDIRQSISGMVNYNNDIADHG